MKTKLSHPADGLYYVTKQMLRTKLNACQYGLQNSVGLFTNHETTAVAVTLSGMKKTDSTYVWWLANRLYSNGKITAAEYHKVDRANDLDIVNYRRTTPNRAAKVMMDVLYERAKREGLA